MINENGRRNMIVGSINLDEILRDNKKLNNIPEVNGSDNGNNGVSDDAKTSINAKAAMKIMITPITVNIEITTRKGINNMKLIGYNHKAKSGWN
ncbi:16885_t:CDS:2 [Dentiscutata erythropus]|uniref:16885_t:CDS:1 n=1 Tax=Dentiscutata erythropus TaxID=1348616 RepID=A0A9N9BL83_9GLOM|nr:16885_t:CDS:2 [Dentiscutata erythropus]